MMQGTRSRLLIPTVAQQQQGKSIRRALRALAMHTLVEAVRLLESKEISSETLVVQCYERAMEGEQELKLNAYTHLCSHDEILTQARASDQRRQAGVAKSLLDGVPVSIKANIAVCDLPLTAASRILHASGRDNAANINISPYDSYVTRRLLRDAGAILIGLTNMDEFGMGSWGTNSPIHGSTRNPRSDLSRNFILSAGGSSSGAAASVAHGSCLLAIGTDTGGSIRLPASWCGVSGFKPSYGLVSRYGIVSYASSLDTVGWIAPTPECCALALPYLTNIENGEKTGDISCGDSTSIYYNMKSNAINRKAANEQPSHRQQPSLPLKGIKIGIPAAFSVDPCPSYIKYIWNKAAKSLAEKGGADVVIVPTSIITPTSIKASLSSYYVLACAEASSNLARYDGLRYGPSYDQLSTSNTDLFHQNNRVEQSNVTGTIINHCETTSDVALENDAANTIDDDLSLVVKQQYSATRAKGFGPEVIRRIIAGTAVLSSDRFHTHYEAAAKQRVILRREFDAAFNSIGTTTDSFCGVDIMLVPTCLSLPCRLLENVDEEESNMSMLSSDVMTVPLSLAGLPTMSVPVMLAEEEYAKSDSFTNDGCYDNIVKSLGLQVFGPPMSEDLVMKVSSLIYRYDS